MDLRTINIHDLRKEYVKKQVTVEEVARHCLDRIQANENIHSFISVNENLLEQAKVLDEKIQRQEALGRLFGIPIAVKDNVCTKGMKTTCASKMLENYVPDYNATIIERLLKEDALIVGKTNMDEFAMGGSSETSYFGITKNPSNPDYIPGGSSSGSATAVATGEVLVAIGTDTGGSVRQPASYCGVVGYKPSYGLISRYGVVSMANTLDTVGILANHVKDVEEVLAVIGGNDPMDFTSVDEKSYSISEEDKEIKEYTFAVPAHMEKYIAKGLLLEEYQRAVEKLRGEGAKIVEVEFEYLDHSLDVYQIIMSGEVNSNLARFDGIRYGFRAAQYEDTDDLFIQTRSQGFGEETKRRIALGALYLATSDDQKLYKKAMKVRQVLTEEFRRVFEKADALLVPTTVEMPVKFGETIKDAMKMYSSDVFNTPVNLGGFCAVSLPLPKKFGSALQIIGNRDQDALILSAAKAVEGKVCND